MNVTVTRMTFEQSNIAQVLEELSINGEIKEDGILIRIENLTETDKNKFTNYLESIGKAWAEL